MSKRWRSLIVRSLIAAGIAWVFASVQLPVIPSYKWFAYVQVPVIIFLLICYIGKILIDTFYHNRYPS